MNKDFLIQRITSVPINNLKKLEFEKTIYILKEMIAIKKLIRFQLNDITDILFGIIPKITNNIHRRDVLNLKRYLFNNLEECKERYLEVVKEYLNEEEYKKIYKHQELRSTYSHLKECYKNEFLLEKRGVEFFLDSLLEDEWFKTALFYSSTPLFSHIYQNENYEKSDKIYDTLARYYIKAATKCTPSGLWSGVSNARWGYGDRNLYSDSLRIRVEPNIRKVIYISRITGCKKIKDGLNISTYLNPTFYKINNQFFYWKVEKNDELKKCSIKESKILYEISKLYKKPLRKIYDVIQFIEQKAKVNHEQARMFAQKLLEADIIRPAIEPRFGSINVFEDLSENYNIYQIGTDMKELSELKKLNSELSDFSFVELRDFTKKISSFIDRYYKDEDVNQNVRVNIGAPWIDMQIDKLIKREAEKSIEDYAYLFRNFYGISYALSDFKERFREGYGYDKFISVVELSFEQKLEENRYSNIKKDNRSWIKPEDTESLDKYRKFIALIKSKIHKDSQEVTLSSDELSPFLKSIERRKKILVETVFQYCKNENRVLIIPEMSSMQYGRLAGRHTRSLEDVKSESILNDVYDSIPSERKEDYYQANIYLNNNIDGIGFNVPRFDKNITLYGPYPKGVDNNININEIYIRLNSKNNEFELYHNKKKKIMVWNASTISPGKDLLANILNNIPNQGTLNLNGHMKTRIELELEYQPRIVFNNLVLSRARYRITASVLINLFKKYANQESLFKEIWEYVIGRGIPYVAYVYNDRNFKPQFIMFNSINVLSVLKKQINECESFIYVEENLPNENHYALNNRSDVYNSEVWSGLCIEM
ncbi:hypothetical protein bcgnr5385_33410 [Bacillus cereus]